MPLVPTALSSRGSPLRLGTKFLFASLFALCAFVLHAGPQDNASQSGQLAPRGQASASDEVVALEPFKVIASTVEMYIYSHKHGGKKIIEYIQVRNLVPGSLADRTGLKKGDRIVAIDDLRLEGLELSSLNGRVFPGKKNDESVTFIFSVRRPKIKEEIHIILRQPLIKQDEKKPNQAPEPTAPGGGRST